MSPNKKLTNSANRLLDPKKPKIQPERINTRSISKGIDTPPSTTTHSTPKNGNSATEISVSELTIKDILDEIKDFRKSMEFMSKQYDELLIKHNLILEENKEMKTQIKEITEINQILQTNYNNINTDINEIKQNKLKRKMIITGIPILNDTNALRTLYDDLITKLEINKEDTQLVDIFQGKHIHSGTQSAPIYVELQSSDIKNTIIQLAKAKQLKANHLGFDSHNKVKIAERLTPYNKNLLREANQLRSHGIKFIWIKYGKIFIRKNHNSEIINIRSSIEIESYKQRNITH